MIISTIPSPAHDREGRKKTGLIISPACLMHVIRRKRQVQIYRAFFESSTGVYSGR